MRFSHKTVGLQMTQIIDDRKMIHNSKNVLIKLHEQISSFEQLKKLNN